MSLSNTGSVRMTHQACVTPIVESWKRGLLNNGYGPSKLIAKGQGQMDVVHLIANRLLAEASDMDNYIVGRSCSEPVHALICGRPGVEKSFITQAAQQLFRALNWVQGHQYQFGAFQAVVADQLGGDTLHHIFHINERRRNSGKGEESGNAHKPHNFSDMRWLFIDEVSQVHATLCSSCETKARSMVQECEPFLFDATGLKRPWGGINVVYIGEFSWTNGLFYI